jgi:hypothetical protein
MQQRVQYPFRPEQEVQSLWWVIPYKPPILCELNRHPVKAIRTAQVVQDILPSCHEETAVTILFLSVLSALTI